MEDVNTINNIASENVDFSMFALFMAADLVVKSVIIVLILASIYSWTIIVSKLLRLRQLKQMEKEFENCVFDAEKFVEGNNSAGTRVRKYMQTIKNLAQEVRVEVQQQKNSVLA